MSLIGQALERFRRETRGATAVVFAVSVMPLLLFTGAAVDYSRAAAMQTRLQAGADSTALNLCKKSNTTTAAQLTQIAQASFGSFMPGTVVNVDPIGVTSNPRQITLTAHATYDTAFMKIARITTVPVSATSGCQSDERFLEIALVLDNTGSMAHSGGGMSKMDALKQASTNFINFVYTDANLASHTKMALVPFSGGVAVDPAAYRSANWIDQNATSRYHWQNFSGAAAAGFPNRLAIFTSLKAVNSTWDWGGCFESLPYPLNTQDGAPSPANPDSYYVPMLAPDEAGNGGQYWRPDSSGTWQLTVNSYINDATSAADCGDPSALNDPTREARACKYVSPQNPQTVGYYTGIGPNWMCNSRPLTRLSTNQSTLLSEIGQMQPAGNTDIHEGLLWGWRTVSPISVFGDGVPYTQANTTKVVVLMTDGFNTWTQNPYNTVIRSFYSSYGYYANVDGSTANTRLPPGNANPATDADARAAMDALTLQTCQNATTAGVVIYTIGFSVTGDPIDPTGLSMLQACAGGPARAFVANDANALIDAFQKIAQDIFRRRIFR